MGPRFLYALIVGAVIVSALALRIWDPSPVARLRSLVFDTYQQIEPRTFDPNLPVRIVDIDEESLKRIGQWPWPRTVLAELVQKLSENGAFESVSSDGELTTTPSSRSMIPKGKCIVRARAA